MTTAATLPIRQDLKAFSFSGLTKYDECSYLFYLANILKMPGMRADTVATRLGSICHESLEEFYGNPDATPSPYIALTRDGGIWDRELTAHSLTQLRTQLQNYAHHMTKLHHRASAGYTGPDKIRKADGTVAAKPEMTKDWKDYVKKNALDGMARHIDQVAARVAPDRWAGISLSEVYSQTLGIMYPYQGDARIHEILHIELPISNVWVQAADAEGKKLYGADGSPVKTARSRGAYPAWKDADGNQELLDVDYDLFLPKVDAEGNLIKDADGNIEFHDNILFHGFIDLLARDAQGRLYIIDHKTSGGDVPAPAKVARHEQLNAYGFAIYYLTGVAPDFLAINHLRSGKLVVAPFDLAKGEKAMARLSSLYAAVEKKVFIKQDPDGYHSKCVRKSFRDGEPPTLCPGLQFCHPDVHKAQTSGLNF